MRACPDLCSHNILGLPSGSWTVQAEHNSAQRTRNNVPLDGLGVGHCRMRFTINVVTDAGRCAFKSGEETAGG